MVVHWSQHLIVETKVQSSALRGTDHRERVGSEQKLQYVESQERLEEAPILVCLAPVNWLAFGGQQAFAHFASKSMERG
jgi:hypothetical protein